MSDELIASLGPLPRTHGMLGAMLESSASYMTDDIHRDPRFRGWWPRNHPDMRSFLGVPIVSGSAEMPSAGRPFTERLITRGVRAVDGLITGWHEPQASHLDLLGALAGPELLERSYREALAPGYRWHEFGDSHLILRR